MDRSSRPLQLRCKTNKGQHVLTGLTMASSVGRLKELIAEASKLPQHCLRVLHGYPPRTVDLSDDSTPLSNLSLRSGDTLIVEEDLSVKAAKQTAVDNVLQGQIEHSRGILMRKVVPANNSCLFTSVNAVMNSGTIDLTCSPQMRQLIASFVKSDPDTYTTVFLSKSNRDYCSWILDRESWGGGIELSILCKYYSVEIAVVDTQSGRIDRFGEDQNYPKRVFLMYDGVHYDPLVLEPLDLTGSIQTMFSIDDATVLAQAMEIGAEAKASRQYTDVGKFSLRCLICDKPLTGASQAQAHAKETNHVNFGEF